MSQSEKAWITEGIKALKKNKLALTCAYFILFICGVAILAPWISPYPFDEQNIDHILQSPNSLHWMGTDKLGRDLFSRVIYGSRMSMAVGVITAIISLIMGTIFGAISGWFGGWVDSVM